jgi:hypothetical protein
MCSRPQVPRFPSTGLFCKSLPVSFDEVHFGGFARKYIKQTFFMDVHPPLAKLLITLAALVGRFDGDFDFKDIGKHVPFLSPLSPAARANSLKGTTSNRTCPTSPCAFFRLSSASQPSHSPT